MKLTKILNKMHAIQYDITTSTISKTSTITQVFIRGKPKEVKTTVRWNSQVNYLE